MALWWIQRKGYSAYPRVLHCGELEVHAFSQVVCCGNFLFDERSSLISSLLVHFALLAFGEYFSHLLFFCLATLLWAFMSSLFSAVKLFRRALSRSHLAWFLNFLIFTIVLSLWSIEVAKMSSKLFGVPSRSGREQASLSFSPLKKTSIIITAGYKSSWIRPVDN